MTNNTYDIAVCGGGFAGAPATIYKQGNILATRYYSSGADGYRLRMLGVAELPDEEKNGVILHEKDL